MSEQKQLTEVSQHYWMLISLKMPIVKDGQVPVYWMKKVAERDAKIFGGKVVKVKCAWKINQNKQS